MPNIHPFKAGICVGAVLGLVHFVWASLVAIDWAKPLMDFVLHLHFIALPYELAPFAIGTAAALVVFTSAVGFVLGFAFALIWNWSAGSSAK